MKVTVCFDNIRVVVPCGDGTLLVKDLMREATLRYKKATGRNDAWLTINSLSSLTGGGLLDPDDRLCDVADDREQIVAHFVSGETIHVGGDGASSVGTNSPDFFHGDHKEQHYVVNPRAANSSSHIKRESAKRLSMHSLSTKEPSLLTPYSAQSLPRESRRKEPLGQDSKSYFDFAVSKNENFCLNGQAANDAEEVVIKNEAGPLGLHVVPCYDLLGNDQGLRVERIESNGRIARDGQIGLHDKIVKINGNNLLHVPFSKVQEIFVTAMNEPCLKISVIKNRKSKSDKDAKNLSNHSSNSKNEADDSQRKIQCSNYNLLQTANTRKIGRMIEIELTKGTNGLGFSVTTRDNPAGGHCPIYIKNILPKGAAVEDGRLRPGDRLLEVNNMEMTGKNQAEVVSLLRSISPGGKVKMVVSRQEEVPSATSDVPVIPSYVPRELTVSSHSAESTDYWKGQSRSPSKKRDVEETGEKIETHSYGEGGLKNPKTSDDVILSPRKNRMILTLDIPVHDSEKAGLGVSVKGKTSSTDDNSSVDLGIFIKSVLHGGAASRDGRLRTNDQLLNVNGVSLLGLSNSDAMETLRRAMLNTNSSVTGVITLTIARRVSSYDGGCEKIYIDSVSNSRSKTELINRVYGGSETATTNQSENRVREKNDLNCQSDTVDNGQINSATSSSPWNPVIDRLTEQYNKNSLRNESYCLATNKTLMEHGNKGQKLAPMHKEDSMESVLAEESSTVGKNQSGRKHNPNAKDGQFSEDPSYDSQLSLEEIGSSGNKFSRDALGRQSMSEKRHAALDAKNTDTYKRNKKLREGREVKSAEPSSTHNQRENLEVPSATPKKAQSVENFENICVKTISRESTFVDEQKTRRSKVNNPDPTPDSNPDYLYTIPGRTKMISPRKHWLVDDVQAEISDANNYRSENDGFPNSRGDVKQASLNSALDDRYKRSRKKGGIRSMLRLGKNRKSLNFGDNIESRQEANNYCSGTINYIA
ncbi:partitioning defective 3 homolog [Neodiprion virginianus]|uniref:partitioning defective 3 homolog n=1 Tax=Neodiprion virginianus TaxID=2961670 RepID=UPI001EE6B045|nr:partitioning defective 3 homolog [Neodiprion virginianus]